MTGVEIEALRQKINEADERLLQAFIDRMEAARAIAGYKLRYRLPIYDPAREQEVTERQQSNVRYDMRDYVRRLYDTIFSLSRELQIKQVLDNSAD